MAKSIDDLCASFSEIFFLKNWVKQKVKIPAESSLEHFSKIRQIICYIHVKACASSVVFILHIYSPVLDYLLIRPASSVYRFDISSICNLT